MKRIMKFTPLLVGAAVVFSSFCLHAASGIKGSITPAESAGDVWAINGTDSIKATPVNGAFSLEAKAGTYKIEVEAKAPYKKFVKENVTVADGETVDLGAITLEQ